MGTVAGILEWYERTTWLRALVQLPPGGGSVDVLLAGKASALNQQRVMQLIELVNAQLEQVKEDQLNKEYLASDEFFDVFRTAAEIVAHSTSNEKRQLVAAYLAGQIRGRPVTDLGAQVLEDLRFLQPIHLQVLAVLPMKGSQGVSKRQVPDGIQEMPIDVYEKTMSDLERYGFIRYNTDGIGTIGGGGGHWETTEYVRIFREHVRL